MSNNIRNIPFKAYLKNLIGKSTKRKLVVFYVDDWGSVRTKDCYAIDYLKKKGIEIDKSRFCKYDTLANEKDLETLYGTLSSTKDSKGNSACFTAVMNPCNPDFESIKTNGYTAFVSEPFTKTLQKYGKGYEHAFELWKEGISKNIFYPMFHGTEHVSRKKLMDALQEQYLPTLWAFECESVGIPTTNGYSVKNIMQPYCIEKSEENKELARNIEWGLNQFELIFGFRSRQFKAGGDIISPELYPTLAENGIEYMDEALYIKRHLGDERYKFFINYTGKRNSLGQKILVRNAVFEPTNDLNFDSVGHCLKLIDAAFKCKKPALISSHRVNFVGGLDENNRKEGLSRLSLLLKAIVKQWPDVEFVNADQAGDIIYETI
ncbi:hypothetical protein LJC57_05730 [Parabacteroides sp. OttesenSCG-928-G07]|nr:hypothetical protein [Parabacteroides sp. OttesenSCG-928-G21]MDL2278074.1 hypothetical protein [Parabacteroides sp. OttesenSCG-928-G07]